MESKVLNKLADKIQGGFKETKTKTKKNKNKNNVIIETILNIYDIRDKIKDDKLMLELDNQLNCLLEALNLQDNKQFE